MTDYTPTDQETGGIDTAGALAIALPRATVHAVTTATHDALAYVEPLDGTETLRLTGDAVRALLAVLAPVAITARAVAPIDTPAWPILDDDTARRDAGVMLA